MDNTQNHSQITGRTNPQDKPHLQESVSGFSKYGNIPARRTPKIYQQDQSQFSDIGSTVNMFGTQN